jgi:hypothetical protein
MNRNLIRRTEASVQGLLERNARIILGIRSLREDEDGLIATLSEMDLTRPSILIRILYTRAVCRRKWLAYALERGPPGEGKLMGLTFEETLMASEILIHAEPEYFTFMDDNLLRGLFKPLIPTRGNLSISRKADWPFPSLALTITLQEVTHGLTINKVAASLAMSAFRDNLRDLLIHPSGLFQEEFFHHDRTPVGPWRPY